MAKKEESNPLLEGLNEQQLKTVVFGNGPLMIVAGAGTGKTTVITRRIAHLIAQGTKPEEILALTFTEKAAAEMEERVDVLLPYGYHDLWVSTFHAFAERILKQHAFDIGLSDNYKLLDTAQQWLLIRRNLNRFELDYYKPLGNPTKFIHAMLKHFSKAKDEEISPEQYLDFAQNLQLDQDNPDFDEESEVARVKEISNAYHVYQQLLHENNALDFGDLINYVLKLFRTRKKVLQFYQNKFKYILVDEFQDTNFAQYELVKMLAGERRNINVVGDDDQSIYKFRGASVSNIMQFKHDFNDAQEITLTENYRSTQNILDTAYNFIQLNNPNRLEPTLKIDKRLKSNLEESGTIAVLSGQTLSDEVEMVVNKILELKKQPDVSWNEFAILVRANDQADPFVNKLASLGIPYAFFANRGLYKKPIIADINSYMKVLLDHHDSSSLYKVITQEPFDFDHNDIVQIMHHAHKKTLSLYEALEQSPAALPQLKKETHQKIAELLRLLSAHGTFASKHNAVEVFITVIKDLKISNRIDEDTLENLENRELVEQFYKKVEAFESENDDKSLRNFMEVLNFELEGGDDGKIDFDPNQGPEAVKLMTIHSSKGLEFNHVFVVNMVHLRFPSTERKESIEIPKALVKEQVPEGDVHLQEERRLFYVAMTRAKRGLYFTYALDYGGQRSRKPSQFLVDIGLVAPPEKSTNLSREVRPKIKDEVDPNIFLPDRFSFTQISDFWKCPMKYKYRHLLHLPLPGNANLSFGNTVHIALEKFLKQYKNNVENSQLDLFSDVGAEGKLPGLKDLLKLYQDSWQDEWYESKTQKEEFRARGKKILEVFYEQFEKDPKVPKYLEKSFRLKLENYVFVGKLDRADVEKNGKIHIFDYKTGQSKFGKDKKDRYQLLIYQWAAEEYLKEQVGCLTYWYLLDGTKSEDFIGTPEDLEEMRSALLETIEEIRDAVRTNSFKELDSKIKHECEFEDLE
jgi:DNA helicase II / ATP-dependent DNA helicase PcrA